ncbi:MAG TPA: zf-HC2 domain-containing protein [Pyrinomonadaceae bacterium]|nr:zf-HC2 domain-containing protein [Pyrinomonadaceae bacterium]
MNCIDIGTLQAFLDGELDLDRSAEVSEHLDACNACTLLLSEAESEEAVVMPALAREFDSLVPTQRLWTKINDHIETEKRERPWYKKLGAVAVTLLARPSFAVATAALLFVVIGAGFWLSKPSENELAANAKTEVSKPGTALANSVQEPATADRPDQPATNEFNDMPQTAAVRHNRTVRAVYTAAEPTHASKAMAVIDPAQQNYESTITELSRSLQGQKDSVMAVPERIAFERDMALVNNTIAKMQAQVRKDPKDASARQVLYSSYQNKIDLLNSVSQKQELVASLR